MIRFVTISSRGAMAALALGLCAGCSETSGDLGGCPDNPIDDPTKSSDNQHGTFAGGENNTPSHMGDLSDGRARDPMEILRQRQEEGPDEIRTRLHSCQKLQIAALSNLLASLGVNIGATGSPLTAAQLLKNGGSALGAASYDARVGESIVWTAAGAVKLFDIFVQAAPEIIANLPNMPQCQVNGVGPSMFDANNQCNADALTCIMGRPATAAHVAICNQIAGKASDIEKGKRIAVAAAMAAAHSCE